MLQLKAVYAIDAPVLALTDWVLRPDWLPEVEGLEWGITTELLETLEAEGRLKVKRLVEKYHDHRRFAAIHTLWFDGKPVMLTQNAGREGDDFKQRWITDTETFVVLCSYLRSRLATDVSQEDTVDPEALFYEEEIFQFYGEDFASQFGFQCEPVTDGYQVHSQIQQILPQVARDLYLVEARAGLEMPEYIRRRGFVLKKERPVSEEEHASNPRIREVCEESGYPQTYLYRGCDRPENTVVLSV